MPRILLWTDDEGLRTTWISALAELGGELFVATNSDDQWTAVDAISARRETPRHLFQVDVLVTDACQPMSAYHPESQVGLITLSPAEWGEVVLPREASDRELRLACRLLAEVVRLRREKELTELSRDVLEHLTQRDPLTKLDNRRGWDQAIERLRREDLHAPLCVVLLDLDHFKGVNDTCGHGVGDDVLQAVALQLLRNVREHDTVARLGGDEYGVLLPGVDAEHAEAVVERIRQAVSTASPDLRCPISASAGYALGRVGDVSQLTERADVALRHAKQEGRGRTEAGC